MQRIDRDRNRLASDVYDRLVGALLQGTLAPGDRLVQDKLAEQLDVSRSPVRDALQRLHAEGIVEPTGRRGFTVRQLTSSDIFCNYEGRLAIEGYSAGRLAELGEPAVQDVWAALEEAKTHPLGDAMQSFEANRRLHRAIVEAIGNHVLLSWFDQSWGLAMSSRVYREYYQAQHNDRFIEDHHALIQAISEGSEATARQAMIDHIKQGMALTPAAPADGVS